MIYNNTIICYMIREEIFLIEREKEKDYCMYDNELNRLEVFKAIALEYLERKRNSSLITIDRTLNRIEEYILQPSVLFKDVCALIFYLFL